MNSIVASSGRGRSRTAWSPTPARPPPAVASRSSRAARRAPVGRSGDCSRKETASQLASASRQSSAGAIVLAPFGVWEVATAPPPAVTIPAIVAVVYSGALAAGIANVFVFNAIRLVGPTRVTASQFLVPAGAVILGALFLQEPVGVGQVAGGAIIVIGVWLTRRPSVFPASRGSRSGAVA